MTVIGYAGASATDPTMESQIATLKQRGCEVIATADDVIRG